MNELIIDVRVNEYTSRRRNPHVPFSPEEIARDAAECERAGASIVHYHARDPASGAPSSDPLLYADTARRVREQSDLLVLPTLGATTVPELEQRYAHIVSMAGDSATRADLAPLDFASTNLDIYDRAKRRFVVDDLVYRNSAATLERLARELDQVGVMPVPVIWNVSSLRLLEAFLEIGWIREPVYLELTLTGEGILAGHPATERGLAALLDFMPDGLDCEWGVLCAGGDPLPMLDVIVGRGGHLSIGLGDYAFPELGAPRNADVIAHVVERAQKLGREPTTPKALRARLGLQA